MDGYFKHSRRLLQQTARDKRLTAADRQILDVAMLRTRNPGDPVGLGIDFLISGTYLDRSTVIRSRRHLIDLGYLIPNGKGQRGLSLFTVPTGGVDATPENMVRGGTDATCGVDATGGVDPTGTGGVDATGTSGVDATHIETGDMETTAIPHGDEKQFSPEAETPPVADTESPDAEPSPPATKSKVKTTSGKVTPKKQYPGDLDADAEKLVDLYAEMVKPKRDDASGSRKVFLGTAKRLLTEGKPSSDMERAVRNYAASRVRLESQEKDPEAARKYRWGFQTFFGPKNEHWKDYAMEMPEEPADEYVDDYNDPKLVAMILEGIERERQGLEVV